MPESLSLYDKVTVVESLHDAADALANVLTGARRVPVRESSVLLSPQERKEEFVTAIRVLASVTDALRRWALEAVPAPEEAPPASEAGIP